MHPHIHFLFTLYSVIIKSLVWSKDKVGNGSKVIEPADGLGGVYTFHTYSNIPSPYYNNATITIYVHKSPLPQTKATG